MPGFGGTQRLARRVGLGSRASSSTRANVIDAERALAIGLVNEVVPQETLLERARGRQKVASKAPLAITAANA